MLQNISLAPLTTLGVGGPARWLVEVRTEDDLRRGLNFARTNRLPIFILGGGSNLLVADEGFNGVVFAIRSKGIDFREQEDRIILSAAAGEDWDSVVSIAVTRNLAGIECLAGIPGSVGGTPVQNVGAYGQEVSETIYRVHAYDLQSSGQVELTPAQCGFDYRTSRFNTTDRGRYIITRVEFSLVLGGAPQITYKDIRQYFENSGQVPVLASVAAAVREIRHAKGMLLVEGEVDCRSAGSFFKNPIVSREKFHQLTNTLGLALEAIPSYPAESGQVKLSAAWLLEQADFHRGYRLGHAGISSRHTLAIVNLGGATAADILALRDQVRTKVKEKFSIELEQEPVQLGF